jgi:hypothetical protein
LSGEIKLDITKELEMLYKELQENDKLFQEVKQHYDQVTKSRGSGTLGFIQNQTANLISLKSGRLNIIQQIINAKKIDAETKLKIANANKDNTGGDEIIRKMADSMYDLIIRNKRDKSFDEILLDGTQKNSISIEEEDIDALLEARLKEEQEEEKLENNKDEEKPKYTYVVDLEKNIYCIDENYNIIEDATIPDLEITIEIDGEEYVAIDQYGNRYDVVEFE